MNENNVLEKKAEGMVTPPPFRQNEEPQEAPGQEPTASPTLADRITELGLDEATAASLTELTQGLRPDEVSADLLATIARGITHDDDVQNADAAGYLRGRNEKIEAVLHPQPQDEEPQGQPVFPRYCRRSIWD